MRLILALAFLVVGDSLPGLLDHFYYLFDGVVGRCS
jgi:hypothetical protein